MFECLILKLRGVLQAWGKHTFETYRPTELFPTRSGLTGLLAAALGVSRNDDDMMLKLDRSYTYAVRLDARGEKTGHKVFGASLLSDYHTIQKVRTFGDKLKPTELSRREYLEDSAFTVALRLREEASRWSLADIEQALCAPVYTLFLGRRSCPLCCPPFDRSLTAANLQEALKADGIAGRVYSEEKVSEGVDCVSFVVRDVPMGRRRFATRAVHMFYMEA